ncbi:MAG: hypothetical protein IT440_04050 [Phycisphaeraceae bacterium]|nr:hypothetical protein [Phycisphaeraceae bacterium]
MAEDLYHEWLSVPKGKREPGIPPDHYALLGLPRFCHHAGAIEEAARRRLETLDKYAIHPDRTKRDAATRIMNEVATARVALSNPQTQQTYAKNLAAQLGVALPSKPVPPPRELVPLEEGESLLELSDAAPPPTDQGGLAPLDASLKDADAPEIKVEIDFSAPRTANVAPIPFKIVLIAGSALALLVVIIVGVIVWATGRRPDTPNDQSGTTIAVSTPNAQPAATGSPSTGSSAAPAPAASAANPARNPDVSDLFDRPTLGDLYRVRGNPGSTCAIADGKMRMQLSGEEAELRVESTPRTATDTFAQVQFAVQMDVGATLTVAIATGSLRLDLERTAAGIKVRATPGRPAGNEQADWPTLPSTGDTLVQAVRENSAVTWKLNGQPVATSPDIQPLGVSNVRFVLISETGQNVKTTIDDMKIWYAGSAN